MRRPRQVSEVGAALSLLAVPGQARWDGVQHVAEFASSPRKRGRYCFRLKLKGAARRPSHRRRVARLTSGTVNDALPNSQEAPRYIVSRSRQLRVNWLRNFR